MEMSLMCVSLSTPIEPGGKEAGIATEWFVITKEDQCA